MFDFPNNAAIQTNRDGFQARILGSFKIEDNATAQASLIKGLTIDDFDAKYPTETFERYSFESLSRAKDDLMKAEGAQSVELDTLTKGMIPVVVAKDSLKKLFYVRRKADVAK